VKKNKENICFESGVYITVFHNDRIDDHVVYDEVRYVRFAAKTKRFSSIYLSKIVSHILTMGLLNRSKTKKIGMSMNHKKLNSDYLA